MVNWLEVGSKVLVYLATLISVGAMTAVQALLPRLEHRADASHLDDARTRTDRALRVAAVCLVVALALRAWAHTVAAFGLLDAFSFANLEIIAVESRWGSGWQEQMVAALLLMAAALAPSRSTTAQRLRVLGILLVCLALPQTGHPARHPLRIMLHAAHVLGGGVWLGTLAIITFVMPTSSRSMLLRAFAPVATTGVGLVVVAGVVMSSLYLGGWSNLWTTGYGRELAAKAAAVALTLGMGALNWRAFHRGSGDASSLPVVEGSMLLVVVLLTAWLTETAHP